ncbi:hypothetical protein EYS14_03565 [Alteromonadaceae bacterium M269]|nr:hypothetical protein EYS14_03565 [Alteromonadaceae bacterium M269]
MKSIWWLQLHDPSKQNPVFLHVDVPEGTGITLFFSRDGVDEKPFLIDIAGQTGNSLVDKPGFWQTLFESESFNDWAVKKLNEEAEESFLMVQGF